MKKSLKKKIDFIFSLFLPTIKNTVFFQSFGGQYNDNPKYVSEELHKVSPDVNIVWAIDRNKCNINDVPSYIKKVDINSKEYVKYSNRSEVQVDNMMGIRGFVSKNKMYFLPKLFKNSRRLNISTWHGIPYKKVGLDMPELDGKKYMYTSASYISAGSMYSKKYFEQAFNPIKIELKGSPRNDILFNNDLSMKNKLKQKLGIPDDKKVVLFAPTFRESVYESGIRQLELLDINKLLSVLSEKFGGEWCFVYRIHHEVLNKIDLNSDKLNASNVIMGNKFDDMAEYLCVSDVLITDYSGSCMDYMLTGNPIFLLTLDLEHYLYDERGTYVSFDWLPFDHACSISELFSLIKKFDEKKYNKKIKNKLIEMNNIEDGLSSSRIVKDIISFLKKGDF